MKKLSILLVIIAVLSALILVSCGGEETPSENSGENNSGANSGCASTMQLGGAATLVGAALARVCLKRKKRGE